MYKYFIIIAITLGSLFSMETVAIIDLEGIGVSEDDARALTQRLTSQMIQIGKYTIVERSEMKRLLDEQKFQYSGCVDIACAVEIGKMLGAKTMVVGSVSKVGTVYSVDARMIDVKSAENYISADYTTTDDIGDLLIEGMKSIAYQLCEKKYTKSKVYRTNQNPNISTTPQKSHIIFKGTPSEDLITVYINNHQKRLTDILVEDFDNTAIVNIGKGVEVKSGMHIIDIHATDIYETKTDTIFVGVGENYIYEYNLECKSHIKLGGVTTSVVDAYIDGKKTLYKTQINPGKYPIIIKPDDSDYEEIEDSITVKECETAYYNIVLKKKKGKVSLTIEPPMADVKIGGSTFKNNSLYDYGKHVYKVSHPYYYPQISSFNLSAPTYEENIILKSGRKDFRELRKRKKRARVASIISLVGLGISYYLHEDAFDKYNSATTPEDATKYRGLFNNTYIIQMTFGGLSAVSVVYTMNLETKFSKLKEVLSIKNPKKKKNSKLKKKRKQKQNQNRKRNQ